MPALIFEKRDHVAYLTLNRPEVHNSLNPEMLVSLAAAWKEIESDDAVRATIVTGAGKVAFSAGADLGKLIPLFTGARKPEDEWDSKLLADRKIGDIALLRGYDMDKPVISAVNGFCIAGGMEFIQGTDLRVASENASFGLQEVKWAIIPAAGSLARLQRQIPYCKAMEILLTGNRIDAQEAWRLGLVNYVVPQEKLIAKAEELAATIAQNGPLGGAQDQRGGAANVGASIRRGVQDRKRNRARSDEVRGREGRPALVHGEAKAELQGSVEPQAPASARIVLG